MNKKYVLNTALAVVLGLALLAVIAMRTFLPRYIVPKAGLANIVLLSLIALVADHYLARGAERCYICIPLFALISFALLPFAAGYASADQIIKLAVTGTVIFTATTFLYTSICERLSSGPAMKAAPILSAACLYLAAQCLNGIAL